MMASLDATRGLHTKVATCINMVALLKALLIKPRRFSQPSGRKCLPVWYVRLGRRSTLLFGTYSF
jgi:hypothetical protein